MAIWREVLARLDHPDVWGPGGLFPLDAFRRTGTGYLARCPNPAHPDRHPSFSMPKGRAFGHCFACGYRRGWIGFVMEQQGAGPEARGEPFWAALRVLAQRAGVALPDRRGGKTSRQTPSDPLLAARSGAAQYLRQALRSPTPEARRVRDYLVARGLAESHLPMFPLGALDHPPSLLKALTAAGCSPKDIRHTGLLEPYMARHSLVFMYTDGRAVTGFKGRIPDPAVKQVKNAKGFGGELEARSLFGLELADEAIAASGRVILVEGEFDALSIQSALLQAKGATAELVALGGTAKPTREKFRTLQALGADVVYLAFDGDPAGEGATAQALPLAWGEGLDALVLLMPEGLKDPDEALRALGLDRCLQDLFALHRAIPGAAWLARYVIRMAGESPEANLRLRRRALELALAVPPGELKAFLEPLGLALDEPVERMTADVRMAGLLAREARLRQRLWAWGREFQARLGGDQPLAPALHEARRTLEEAAAEIDRPEATETEP